MKFPPHGANPGYLYQAAGFTKPATVLDFSVNTNPFGAPDWLRDMWPLLWSEVENYPDPNGTKAVSALAQKFGILPGQLLLGNGAAEIIHFIARSAAGKKAVIVTPAFSEYEEACRAYDCEIEFVHVEPANWQLPVALLTEKAKSAAVLFLCTPNNPTGQVFSEEEVIDLLEKTKQTGALVVIDEAFYDFASSESLISFVSSFPHLAVMHSLTKMYAIAGLRIGYAAASPSVISMLARYRPHWNVNAIALKAAEKIAENDFHAEKTREKIMKERQLVCKQIQMLGYSVLPSKVNFYLLRDPALQNQQPLLEFLLKKGMVLRHTENFRGLDGKWLRCAVKCSEDNKQLIGALAEWKKPC